MRVSGRSPDGKFVEIAELPDAPVVPGRAVPPRVPVAPAAAASAVRRASSKRRTAQDGELATGRPRAVGGSTRRPCRSAGPCTPSALGRNRRRAAARVHRRALRHRERGARAGAGDRAPRDRRAARRAVHLQGVLRQGQPHIAGVVPRPGPRGGLRTLAEVKARTGLPVLTDIHERRRPHRPPPSPTCCRFPRSSPGRPTCSSPPRAPAAVVNVKKGQFLAPWDMRHVVDKVTGAGNEHRPRHRARGQLRLQQPGRRHAVVPDAARAGLSRSSSTSPTACSCQARATASPAAWRGASSRWPRPAWPPASMRSSWKCTRTRRGRRATPPTRCGWNTSNR